MTLPHRTPTLALVGLLLAAGLVGCGPTPPPTPTPPPPTPTPTRPPVALGPVEVIPVGPVVQGGTSERRLELRFTEAEIASIGKGPGSLQITLTDDAGQPATVGFGGAPVVEGAPGSLGASASLLTSNVLMISLADSDPLNLEPFVVTGLSITATAGAALGPIKATIGGCSGSLAGCTAVDVLASPGEVVGAA